MEHESNGSVNGSQDTLEYAHTPIRTDRSGSGSPTDLSFPIPKRIQEKLSSEPLVVQAAFEYLTNLKCTIWADWLISQPDRRLEAARWLGKQHQAVEKVLTSNKFSPTGQPPGYRLDNGSRPR